MIKTVKKNKYEHNRLLDVKGQYSLRVSPELALEIGLNESMVFLQLEFLIAISNHSHGSHRWTYQTVDDLKEMFPFWSRTTINRTIKSLEEKALIIVGCFNRRKYDRTRWFAINLDEARKLKSITVKAGDLTTPQNGSSTSQNGTRLDQNASAKCQDGITIPNITTDNTTQITEENKSTKVTQQMPAAFVECSNPPPTSKVETNLSLTADTETSDSAKNPRSVLRDTETGPVKRIFDFHAKVTGRKRPKLTEEKRTAIASRISSDWVINPDQFDEEDIKLAILGCLKSKDHRDTFLCVSDATPVLKLFKPDEHENLIYIGERGDSDLFRWRDDLRYICASPDRIGRFINMAIDNGLDWIDVDTIEASKAERAIDTDEDLGEADAA